MSAVQRFTNKCEPLWHDRDVRFDVTAQELKLRNGEAIIEYFLNVEDTKGNSGEDGKLTITNLRMIWQSKNKPRINLSIGLGCISTITNRTIHSKVRGKHDALYIMTKVNGTRYEFIFTHTAAHEHGQSTGMVELMSKVCRAYASTKLFRDLKLRSAIISSTGKQLKILPSETIYNKINGVWNLSSDQGNLGTMHLTNKRIIWHANMNELFNISLPYIQVNAIKVRESKFGVALVIESSESSGGYVLGFRIDPVERLHTVYNELINLYNIHSDNPDMGVMNYFDTPSESVFNEQTLQSSMTDQTDIEEKSENETHDAIAAYLADDGDNKDCEIVYNPQLGLAIEKIKEGFTLDSLWHVIPQN